MSNAEAAFNRLTPDIRSRFFPGGLEQAERAASSIEYIIGKIDDYDKVLDLYRDIAVRVGIMGFDDDRANITLQMRYGNIVPKHLSITLIHRIRRLFQNYQFLYHDKSEADMFSAFISQSDSYQRNAAKKNDATNKPDFGTDPDNPIYANSAWGSYEYLNKLYSTDLIPLTWVRIGSFSSGSPDPLDKYQLYLPDGKEHLIVYINMYSKETSIYCPKGTKSFELKNLPSSAYSSENIKSFEGNSFSESALFCHSCGFPLPEDSIFCQYCGAKIEPEKKNGPNLENNKHEHSKQPIRTISSDNAETQQISTNSLPHKETVNQAKTKKHKFATTIFILLFLLASIYFGCLQLSYLRLNNHDIINANNFILSPTIYKPFFKDYIDYLDAVTLFTRREYKKAEAIFQTLPEQYLNTSYYLDYINKSSEPDPVDDSEQNSVEAIYEPTSLTLNKNGGTGGSDYVTVEFGKPLPNNLTPPTKTGYVFLGYFDSTSSYATQYYSPEMKSTHNWYANLSDKELYAHWEKKDLSSTSEANNDEQSIYTVTLNKEGGNGGTDHIRVKFGKLLPSGATAPVREGYSFKGYFSTTSVYGTKFYDQNMKPIYPWNKKSDGELFAQWEKID